MAAPVLEWTGASHRLAWTWGDEDPFIWLIFESDEEDGFYQQVDEVSGDIREFEVPDLEVWYKVIGQGILPPPSTGYSNAVFAEP